MDFILNTEELALLYGLSHIQQLTYLRGIRPYMDYKTFIVGVKRKISYTSIAEQLYVEPHQGIKAPSFSRDQVRRAVAGLARVGIVSVLSEDLSLILKCELASVRFYVQNKAAINPPFQATINPPEKKLINSESSRIEEQKADIANPQKAATPLVNNNFLIIFFEKFWESYPQKKSKSAAWEAFQSLNPDNTLCQKILKALEAQINHCTHLQQQGTWVPPWKYPANWILNQCWEDEINTDFLQEKPYAKGKTNSRRDDAPKAMFWVPDDVEDTEPVSVTGNVIAFKGGF